jgi:hypothetical protein
MWPSEKCGGLVPDHWDEIYRLWEQFNGGVRMLMNLISYKIEMIGKAKRTLTVRGKQIKASRVIIEVRLD